jgi:uncharacterized surface anchored protein
LRKLFKNFMYALLFLLFIVPFKTEAAENKGTLVINVYDSSSNEGVSGAYFTVSSLADASTSFLVKTDQSGNITLSLEPGDYMIKQQASTDKQENYGFTSIGYSRKIEAGQTVTVVGYERKLPGSYAFSNSPTSIHISQNSPFDFSVKSNGIEASRLSGSGVPEAAITAAQIYPYYTNVDPTIPGEYVAIFKARQASFNEFTSYVVKVIVDPEVPASLAHVFVKYVDDNGNEISEMQTISGRAGEPYDVSGAQYQLAIEGYTLNEALKPNNCQGFFTSNPQTVTYVYTKKAEQPSRSAQKVLVHYVDEMGTTLHESQQLTGELGQPYDVSSSDFRLALPGYELDETKIPANQRGFFTEQQQSVTYVYRKVNQPVENIDEPADLENQKKVRPAKGKASSDSKAVAQEKQGSKSQLPKTGINTTTNEVLSGSFLFFLAAGGLYLQFVRKS